MKEKMRKILIIIFCLIALGCAGYLIWYYVMADKVNDSYDKAREEAVKQEKPEAETPEESEVVDIPIDFTALQATNPDVYAWIKIEGTNIDYPVLQSMEHDNYYLDHTWEGVSASQGAIFSQAFNSKDFTDFNTVIYGHQMGDGNDTMFHNLGNYLDKDFMNEHQDITIYTPENIRTYRVFAAVIYDDRHLLQHYNFLLDKDRQDFLDSLYNARDLRNQYQDDVEVGITDRIISLSTCVSAEPEHRLLVEAVLVDEK